MGAMLTIARRDFRGYVSGPGFYIVMSLLTLFLGFTFANAFHNFAGRSAMMMAQMQGMGGGLNFHSEVIVQHVSNLNLIMLIMTPFLTVKLFSEETKLRTFDLLMTSPVNATQIVAGKFIAAMGAVGIIILVSLLYPLASSLFAEIEWGPFFTAYLGLILICMVYVAVGMFSSSLTDSAVIAGFIAIILSLMLWFIAWSGSNVDDPFWTTVIQQISVVQHFTPLIRGSLQASDVCFFVSVAFLYCFLTQRVVESLRWRS